MPSPASSAAIAAAAATKLVQAAELAASKLVQAAELASSKVAAAAVAAQRVADAAVSLEGHVAANGDRITSLEARLYPIESKVDVMLDIVKGLKLIGSLLLWCGAFLSSAAIIYGVFHTIK